MGKTKKPLTEPKPGKPFANSTEVQWTILSQPEKNESASEKKKIKMCSDNEERYDRWDLLVNKYVFSQELDDIAKTNNRILARNAKNLGCLHETSSARKSKPKKKQEQQTNSGNSDDSMTKLYLESFDETLLMK